MPETYRAEITLREVYDILVDVRQDVTAIKQDLDQTKNVSADHEVRLRGLEKSFWRAVGASSVLGASGGYLATLILPPF